MRNDVNKLLDRLQILSQIHDIRQFAPMITHEADKIQKKCNFDYLGDLHNTLSRLIDSVELEQNLQEKRILDITPK